MKLIIILIMALLVVCAINNIALLVAYLKADKKLAKHGESKFYNEVKTKK